jgi:GT2 family glycosyltransferase
MLQDDGWLNNAQVDYLRLEENTGGAGGFHAGVDRAMAQGADWIWLMDDDAMPESDALSRLLSALQPDERPPVLATQVVTSEGTPDIAHRVRVRSRPLWAWHVPADEYRQPAFAADVVSFVGSLIHRQYVQNCGLPRAEYFLYYDDFEFTYRIRCAGYAIRVVPASRIRHRDDWRSLPQTLREQSWGWRMYYRVRNCVHWYRSIALDPLSLLPKLVTMILIQWTLIILLQPRKLRLTRLLARAIADGWSGRLGRLVEP